MAVTGIVTALYDRQQSGNGAHLDISMTESASWFLGGAEGELSDSAFGIPVSASRRLYECSDGRWVSVAADEPRTWAALCKGLGLDDLAEGATVGPGRGGTTDRRCASDPVCCGMGRGARADRIHDFAGPPGLVARSTTRRYARHAVVEVDGKPIPANPIRINGPDGPRTTTITTPPASNGVHTDEVLSEAGFTTAEIEELRSSGVLGDVK